MITVSVCMIVKNEERVLKRCLDSLAGLYDELIVVDTGSTDNTKKIASEYTDKIYDFEWVQDFSAARNYSLSFATCDYIYVADADEVIDEENRKRFMAVKEVMDPQVEIIQMYYVNQLASGSVYNFDRELRAKMFRRERRFVYTDPIHEIIRTEPVVFDSDIEIMHMPEKPHTGRDLETFRRAVNRDGQLSRRLVNMYARELLMSGTDEDFAGAADYFHNLCDNPDINADDLRSALIVMTMNAYRNGDANDIMLYAMKDIAVGGSSEVCYILGMYWERMGNIPEALMWYVNAKDESSALLALCYQNELPEAAIRRLTE